MTPPVDTVLLVEDAQDLGPLLRETLEEWSHRALLAQTGAEAMDVLARESVALLLLDHELPDMTGPELLEALRSRNLRIPPTVLMTARQHPEGEGTSPDLVEVLQKPFDLADLAGVLKRHLPRR